MAVAQTTSEISSGSAPLTVPQKVAVLLLMLGSENAAQVLRGLDEARVEEICAEMNRLGEVPQETQSEVLREFAGVLVQSTTMVRGGADFIQAALEKGLGAPKASAILGRVGAQPPTETSLRKLSDLDAGQIYLGLRGERPQIAALIISGLCPQVASKVLNRFPPETREQIVERVALLEPASAEVIDRLVAALIQKTGPAQVRRVAQIGGVKAAASVLNAFDKRSGHGLLNALEGRNPELGQALRQSMFTFEDLVRLDAPTLQRILREVEPRDLAIALKRASEPLRNSLLSCISRRAAEGIKEEMAYLNSLKLKDIEAAQARIIAVLRRLESEGEIDLGSEEEEHVQNRA